MTSQQHLALTFRFMEGMETGRERCRALVLSGVRIRKLITEGISRTLKDVLGGRSGELVAEQR